MTSQILVVLCRPETANACLAAAGQIAGCYDHPVLTVLHVRRDPESTILPSEEVLTTTHRAEIEAHEAQRADMIRQTFDAWLPGAPALGKSAKWVDMVGDIEQEVQRRSMGSALIVLGQAPKVQHEQDRKAIKAVLFEARHPMLVVPETWRGTLGHRVAIAWKPGDQAERAIAAAMPILRHAERVVVLTVCRSDEADMAALEAVLARNAITAMIDRIDPDGTSVGQTLIREVHEHGADLLVTGAYSHSRIYEFVLGGVTRRVLQHADLPALMAH